jgi:malonyl-ACP decarboxylase
MIGKQRVVITGMGIVSPCAIGVPAFTSALREGRPSAFSSLRVEGIRRDLPAALLDGFAFASSLEAHANAAPVRVASAERIGRRSARTIQVALLAALEAIIDAGLGDAVNAPAHDALLARCGVVVAGQNLNQRTVFDNAIAFTTAPEHLSPAYAMHCLDTDHVGAISELLGSRAEGMSIGGASASGNVAIVQALRLVRDGYLPACLVVGAMTDLSPMELGALESLGALAGAEQQRPDESCRPFDRDREGFVYGQSCACMVLESLEHARARGARISGEVLGGSVVLDGRRSTEPSAHGEASAMKKALADARIEPAKIDYLNAHGTASRIGDSTEIEAIADVLGADHLRRVWVNSTKGLVGHGLTAAGVTEAVATILQMREGFVHANKNLVNPLREGVRFAPAAESVAADLGIAMSNSFGFGGFNTSIVVSRSV